MSISGQNQDSVTIYDVAKAFNGYTLFAPLGGDEVCLMDMKGHLFHKWKLPYPTTGHGKLLPNGNLLFAARTVSGPLEEFQGAGGELLEMDWDGKVVWHYEDPYMHDDFYRMENGNTLVTRWVPTPSSIATRVKGGLDGTESQGTMLGDSFRELDPDGNVLWEWLAYEHLDPKVDAICPLCSRSEWTHANSCVVLLDGNILASFARINSIVIINKRTGNIDWQWGSQELAHQHDASLMKDGKVLMLDSGLHAPGLETGNSRLLEVDINTKEMVWEYTADRWIDFYAPLMGNCQRLPNGNTLICQGDVGRVFEITSQGDIVWEFTSPFYHSLAVYGWSNMFCRAYRYGHDYSGLAGESLMAEEVKLTPQEELTKEEKAVQKRLKRLGY